MDGPEKRLHVVTGNTRNKPSEKRPREQEVEGIPEERPARRTLAFQEKGSPLQKVFVYFLGHRFVYFLILFLLSSQRICKSST